MQAACLGACIRFGGPSAGSAAGGALRLPRQRPGPAPSLARPRAGESFAWGGNSMGQCGSGSVKKVKGGEDNILTPTMVGGCRAGAARRR